MGRWPLCPCGKALLLQSGKCGMSRSKGLGPQVVALPWPCPHGPWVGAVPCPDGPQAPNLPPSFFSVAPVTPAQHFRVGTQEPDSARLPCDMPPGSQGASLAIINSLCPRLRILAVQPLQVGRPRLRDWGGAGVGERVRTEQWHHPPLLASGKEQGLNPFTLGSSEGHPPSCCPRTGLETVHSGLRCQKPQG